MPAPVNPSMDDIVKLTRGGRLAEATALIRRGLGAVTGRAAPLPAASAPEASPSPGFWPSQAWASRDRVSPNQASKGRAARGRAAPDTEAPAQPGSFVWRTAADAAGTRRFKLYVPKGFSGRPLPLLLMLHGCTQSPDDFAAGTRMNEVADDLGVLVAYPEQTRSANAGRCWNWFKPGDQQRGGGEPSILAEVVRQVGRELPVTQGRVFVAGLSAGGAAATVLAHAYPDLFAGVGVHSGLAGGCARDLPTALAAMRDGAGGRGAPARAVPTIVFHGTADRTVSPANAGHVMDAAVAGMAAPEVVNGRSKAGAAFTRRVYRDRRGRARAENWSVEGMGHAWSGGSPAGSYTDPSGPDASREMMRFFLDL